MRPALISWLMVLAVTSAFAQRPFAPVGLGMLGPGGLRGPAIQGVGTESPLPPSGPNWFTAGSQAYTPNTGLEFPSAVYDPRSKVMIVFGGLDFGGEATSTNAVLLYAPANSLSANFTTLIANGAAGAPPARASHSAVYDAANNRMIFILFPPCFNSVLIQGHVRTNGQT